MKRKAKCEFVLNGPQDISISAVSIYAEVFCSPQKREKQFEPALNIHELISILTHIGSYLVSTAFQREQLHLH